MIRIIDATLANMDDYSITQKQIIKFCEYMKQIGIVDLEISTKCYGIFDVLPAGFRFYLRLDPFQKTCDYKGIYKFEIPRGENEEHCISTFQINDSREVSNMRQYSHLDFVKITGLDDLMCTNPIYIMNELRGIFKGRELFFCPENTYYCAAALAVLWLGTGEKNIITSFMGLGCLAPTEEVYMAMHVTNRYKPNQSLSILQAVAAWYEEITGDRISAFKPVIGKKIFHVESGIHVDGIIKNPANYEAYCPNLVGRKTKIVIGKHSGTNSIKIKTSEYGIELDDPYLIQEILRQVKQISMENRKSLSDKEFLELVSEVLANDGKKIHS